MSLKDRLLVDNDHDVEAGISVANQLLQRISNTSKEGEKLLKKVGTAQDTCQVRDQLKENIGRLTTDIKDVKNQIDRLGRRCADY